ncbi:MAG TPA: hypothetical protein VF576_02860 [Rubricoccaceae bacterium]|jgi:hypothetical protein
MRTFSESEARDVFARAAREHQAARDAAAQAAGGLTLDELAEVGEASGIPRAFVVAAARAVEHGLPESGRETRAGFTTGVRHTAFLTAPPSDDLWDALVADARRTFGARGKTDAVGRAREWRNGNLTVSLEPSGDGSRLHLRTRRGEGAPIVPLAAAFIAVGALLASTDGSGAWVALLIALLCAVTSGATWVRQRTWAALREGQMRGIAERAARVADRTAPGTTAAEAVPAPPLLDLDGLGDAPDGTTSDGTTPDGTAPDSTPAPRPRTHS